MKNFSYGKCIIVEIDIRGIIMKSIYKYSLIILSCVLLVNLACEDVDLEGQDAGNVQGFWQIGSSLTGNNTFLLVSDTEFAFYYYNSRENCITNDAYDVERIDGTGFYIVTQEGLTESKVFALSFDGNSLAVRDIEETQKEILWFQKSEVDIDTFAPICFDETDVFGEWELIQENEPPVYLSITQDTLQVIDVFQNQECYLKTKLEILEINGNFFTVSNNDPNVDSSTQEIKITRTLDGLEVERTEGGENILENFTESEEDFSTLNPECDFNSLDFYAGKWQHQNTQIENEPVYFLTVDTDTISYHFEIGDPINDPDNVCFEIQKFEVLSISDTNIDVRETFDPFGEFTFTFDFDLSLNLMVLYDREAVLTFSESDIDDGYINNQCDTPDN